MEATSLLTKLKPFARYHCFCQQISAQAHTLVAAVSAVLLLLLQWHVSCLLCIYHQKATLLVYLLMYIICLRTALLQYMTCQHSGCNLVYNGRSQLLQHAVCFPLTRHSATRSRHLQLHLPSSLPCPAWAMWQCPQAASKVVLLLAPSRV